MSKRAQPGEEDRPVPRKKRTSPIQVLPPQVVPMSDAEKDQALTAIAAMIATWWHDHHNDPDE